MIVFKVLAYVFGIFGVVGTVMPFLPYDDWWIRGFDYPRQQLVFILALAAVCWIFAYEQSGWVNWTVSIVLVTAALYQAYRILPYTPVWQKDAADAEILDNDNHLSLMMANVLQTNRNVEKVVEQTREMQPDILLTVETNNWWAERLDAAFGDDYPHRVHVPLENLYGMNLYSRIELIEPEIRYRIKDDIPSIDTRVKLKNGREVNLYFVHPMPPSPTEAYASTGRDAELAMVGRLVRERGGTTIVAGDLNDVAWSHSTRLFKRLSQLLDPRRGRGLFSTFHADYRMARWPLDHVFHSTDLAVVDLEKLGNNGSDHFPVYIKLSYEPNADSDVPDQADADDLEEAEETIDTARAGKVDAILKD